MPWTAASPRRARERAEAALRSDPRWSDQVIARQAGVSAQTAARTRRLLEQAGQIPAIPVARRRRSPYPRQQSPTRLAILRGAVTSRQIAGQAGVSMQAAWKARRRHGQPASPLPPPVAECERCGRPFVIADRPGPGTGHKFCTDACCYQAHNDRRRERRRAERAAAETPSWPVTGTLMETIPPLVLMAGLCVTGDIPRHLWTSDLEDDRELARAWCRVCPARIACGEWALRVLPRSDDCIYGGLDGRERRRLRRQQQAPA